MENSQSLKIKISIMEKELELARLRLQYSLAIESEAQRSSLASGLSPTTKQADALPKSTIESSQAPQKEIVNPCPLGKKLTASPVDQTATGKDKSSPLMAVDLPKILEQGQTSRLVTEKEINLRPNGNQEKPFKDLLIPTTNEKHYYVVFNGPFAGIYDDWKNARAATKNISDVKFKKYKSLLEANVAAEQFARDNLCSPAKLITKEICLKPDSFSKVLSRPKDRKVSLGRPVQIPEKKKQEPSEAQTEKLSLKAFNWWYSEARTAEENKLVDEKYFTTDNTNLSYFNFVKNADPEQVYEAFRYGLVRSIYPSVNLQELRSFPKAFINAVKKFRTKTSSGKADRDIYLKVSSALPVFINGEIAYEPHHIVQIGFSKDARYEPSKAMELTVEKDDLIELAKRKFNNVLDKAFDFYDESRSFINYVDDRILLHSKKATVIGEEDIPKILQFRKTMTKHLIFGEHFEDLCLLISKKDDSFQCPLCKAAAEIKHNLKVDTHCSSDDSHHMGDDIGFDFIFGPPNNEPTK